MISEGKHRANCTLNPFAQKRDETDPYDEKAVMPLFRHGFCGESRISARFFFRWRFLLLTLCDFTGKLIYDRIILGEVFRCPSDFSENKIKRKRR